MPAGNGMSLLGLVHAASAQPNPEMGTVPIANATYVTNADDSVLWNTSMATEVFNAPKNDSAIPNGLLGGGTTIG
jgi:hypothetical protein